MPYWSSSRVGPSNGGNSSKRSERHNKRKGITMEDLKKQTALRLAHEHYNRESDTGAPSQADSNAVEAAAPRPPPSVSSSSFGGASGSTTPILSTPERVGRNTPSSYPSNNNNSSNNVDYYCLSNSSSNNNNSSSSNTYAGNNRAPPPPDIGSPLVPILVASLASSSSSTTATVVGNSSSATVSSTDGVDTAPHGATSMLPHGLTVHELKEITKARLGVVTTDSIPEATSMEHSHHLHNSFSNNHSLRQSSSPSAAMMYSSRDEAWETASVSTAASNDYSFVGGGSTHDPHHHHQQQSFHGSNSSEYGAMQQLPFGRSTSYPNKNNGSFESNRRRALTLSPRPPHHHRQQQHSYANGVFTANAPTFVPSSPRGRTHSSASLPALNHSFSGGGAPNLHPVSTLSSSSFHTDPTFHDPTFGSDPTGNTFRSDHVPTTTASMLYNNISAAASATVTGLSDAFRESSWTNAATAANNDSFDVDVGCGALRGRASTWAAPPALNSSVDEVSDDLASILKLTGM